MSEPARVDYALYGSRILILLAVVLFAIAAWEQKSVVDLGLALFAAAHLV